MAEIDDLKAELVKLAPQVDAADKALATLHAEAAEIAEHLAEVKAATIAQSAARDPLRARQMSLQNQSSPRT